MILGAARAVVAFRVQLGEPQRNGYSIEYPFFFVCCFFSLLNNHSMLTVDAVNIEWCLFL